jgi:hypothetical protein
MTIETSLTGSRWHGQDREGGDVKMLVEIALQSKDHLTIYCPNYGVLALSQKKVILAS